MGTIARVQVHDPVPTRWREAAIDEVNAVLDRLEAAFSPFRATSEIARLAAGELSWSACSEELLEVAAACAWLERRSGGAFCARRPPGSPTPRGAPTLGPGAFDPTGFVKGWATERAAEALTAAGLRHWSVEVGGDLVTRGQPTPDRLWHVAVRDPWRPAAVVAVLGIRDAAVATSGAYERGEHIWRRAAAEARDGDLAAVTVVGPHLAWADAFATAAFAMGAADRAIEWVASFAGYDALAVRAGGDLLASADFERHLAPPPTGPAGPENFPVFGNRASAAGKSQR